MMKPFGLTPLLAVLLASAPPFGPARFTLPAKVPSPRRLTPAVRQRIDREALATSLEEPSERGVDLAGDLGAWILRGLVLTAAEEFDAASAAHRSLLKQHQGHVLPPPSAARQVFERLVAELPRPMKPEPFRFALTVLDYPEVSAFAGGGGYVYVTRGLLDALAADKERGRAALAFVLGHELGHIGLGHCRRGYQLLRLQRELQRDIALKVSSKRLRALLGTSVAPAGRLVTFLYTRAQHHRADLFAFHLCRNAHFDLDACLDSLRWLVAVRNPTLPGGKGDPEGATSLLAYYLSTHPGPLRRLKCLLMERSGTVEGTQFGLFRYTARTGALRRCTDGAVRGGTGCVIFVHGLHGGERSFDAFLAFLAARPEARGLSLLVFRYPNDGSLTHAGRFLHREMARVVRAPGRASFVCHSAGGLVFRHYAEKECGAFDRAVFLGTPHGGSRMTALKILVDGAAFADNLQLGLARAMGATVVEGKGDLMPDVQPDSLFLRHLGHDARLARRYHVVYGRYVSGKRVLALWASFLVAKLALKKAIRDRADSVVVRANGLRLVDGLELTDEVLDGDLVVSVASARLKGAGRQTATTCHHQALKTDAGVMRAVAEFLFTAAP